MRIVLSFQTRSRKLKRKILRLRIRSAQDETRRSALSFRAGSGNSQLTDAAIWYVPNSESKVTKSGSVCAAEAALRNIADGSYIILSAYSGGKLIAADYRQYSTDSETFTVSGDIDKIKVMIWKDLQSFTPIGDAEVIEKNEWEESAE